MDINTRAGGAIILLLVDTPSRWRQLTRSAMMVSLSVYQIVFDGLGIDFPIYHATALDFGGL